MTIFRAINMSSLLLQLCPGEAVFPEPGKHVCFALYKWAYPLAQGCLISKVTLLLAKPCKTTTHWSSTEPL